MTMSKYDRLIYKKNAMNLSKLLNDRLISRSINEKKITFIINKFELIFSSNELTYSSIRKRTSARRIARSCAVSSRQNKTTRTRLLTCRKRTFLKMCKNVR